MARWVRVLSDKRLGMTVALLLAVALAACRPEAASPADQALERARKAADALTVELAGRLGEELQRGGPAAAISVCSESAPARVAAPGP